MPPCTAYAVAAPTARRYRRLLAAVVVAILALQTPVSSQEAAPRRGLQHSDDDRAARAAALADAGDLLGADAIYRALLRDDPENDAAHASIARLWEGVVPSKESPAYHETRRLLPPSFREFETRRFVVLSDASTAWTKTQTHRLERTHHQFERFARRMQLRPLPLRHKLVCVLFEDRGDYHDFARRNDGVTDPWIAGYYSPEHDRIVFYHVETNPSIVEARAALDEIRGRIDELERSANQAARLGQLEQAEALRGESSRFETHLQHEQHRVNHFAGQLTASTTIHEVVHQLLFHTRIQSAHVAYPLWISEGLATAFETDDSDAIFGPDREYTLRREGFQTLIGAGERVPLRRFVTLEKVPDGDEASIRAVYHQSYALVTWMQRFYRDELRAYLMSMLREPPGPVSPQRHLQLFEAAFGDVDRLERSWLRHERASG